jgi:hypothetical protein
MEIAAKEDPLNFVRIAGQPIPKEMALQVTNQPSSLNGMSVGDLNAMLGLLDAIKSRLANARTHTPADVFEYVGRALDAYAPRLIPAG